MNESKRTRQSRRRSARRPSGKVVASTIVLAFLILSASLNAVYASFHLVRINEVMAGLNGDSNIQFVEIVTALEDQKRWGPHQDTVGRTMLLFSNHAGVQTGRFVFPSDPAPDADPASGADTVLIATQAFADLTGLTPDFVIPVQVMPIAGQVCFTGNPDASDKEPVNLCLSYGGTGFTGVTSTSDGPNSADLAVMDSQSLTRISPFNTGPDSNTNANFALATPTPATTQSTGTATDLEQNVTGEVVLPTAAAESAQGETLFTQETFLGNGRTCASCHTAQDDFGLSLSSVAAAPNDDPLFIHESNINTLVIDGGDTTGASQPSDFKLGGTITGSLGGSAVVLAGTGDSYLIIAGSTLDVADNVISDGTNSGTLVSFTAGNLPGPTPNGDTRGLDDPILLRGGRALITENINGFDEHAFMRGSPALINIKLTAPYGLSAEFTDLQTFSAGAIAQHFTRDLNRVEGQDFRTATTAELDAMTDFMETNVVPQDQNFDDVNDFDRFVTTAAQQRGQALFFGEAKCSVCHSGPALATSSGEFGTTLGVNESFNTGVAKQTINTDDGLPTEQDIGQPANSREFSTQGLFGIKNKEFFFHDNSASSLFDAILFYSTIKFGNSPAFDVIETMTNLIAPGVAEDIEAFIAGLADLPFTFTSTVDFGTVAEAEIAGPITVTITNTGVEDLTITNVVFDGADPDLFTAAAIAPDSGPFAMGESRTIDVSFDLLALSPRSAILELEISTAQASFDVGVALSGQAADSDADGMPDGFELASGLAPLDPADAALDADGDGHSNLKEFEAGTDPNDVDSRPILSMPWLPLLFDD